ncbi:unnamed protein product [Heligmosomoides polygyrus]|uniref:Uncharacterized protein n=1 Tax=Heligmosomoides polygyrus TaxID=6339 RepID=A0A183GCU9_HELPZ|nr:unnamed protein product [Heligmosomoides polygyrus]
MPRGQVRNVAREAAQRRKKKLRLAHTRRHSLIAINSPLPNFDPPGASARPGRAITATEIEGGASIRSEPVTVARRTQTESRSTCLFQDKTHTACEELLHSERRDTAAAHDGDRGGGEETRVGGTLPGKRGGGVPDRKEHSPTDCHLVVHIENLLNDEDHNVISERGTTITTYEFDPINKEGRNPSKQSSSSRGESSSTRSGSSHETKDSATTTVGDGRSSAG